MAFQAALIVRDRVNRQETRTDSNDSMHSTLLLFKTGAVERGSFPGYFPKK